MLSTRRTVLSLRSLMSVLAVGAVTATTLAADPGLSAPSGTDLAPMAQAEAPEVQSLEVPELDESAEARAAADEAGPSLHELVPGSDLAEVAHLEAPSTRDYSMLGVTWADPAAGEGLHVEVRAHDGTEWSTWAELPIHTDHQADPSMPDVRGGTDPMWVGPSEGIEVRVLSDGAEVPADLKVELVDPGEAPAVQLMSSGLAAMPRMIGRREWGANAGLRSSCSPVHGPTVRGVVVHHTVNANDYSRTQSVDIVRGIYAYHTKSQGWCDIGYNFLIDRFGQIFEGRAGGVRTPVRGAHAGNWAVNEQTTGVSLIGNFETARPTTAMQDALVEFIAWRLETYYRDPKGTSWIDGNRYRAIIGHRDVKSTACPGRHVYDWLPTLRNRVEERMGDWRNPIYQKWQDHGGSSGFIGLPFRGEISQSGGRNTRFQNAVIYWSSTTGAHEVHGEVLDGAYRRAGGAAGVLGFPTSDVLPASGGRDAVRSSFQNGVVYASKETGSHEIHGPVYDAYAKQGWTTGPLGLPTSDVVEASVGEASRSSFQGGVIYQRNDIGAHALHGSVYDAYAKQGWTTGPLGLPTSGIVDSTQGDGARASFEGGAIYKREDLGVSALHGPIYDAYAAQGWTTGPLGLPDTGVRATSKGGGEQAGFVGGAIYHHRTLGTHVLTGDFYDAYARQRWTLGPLGLPSSDVTRAGARNSTKMAFQEGFIYYRSDVGAHEIHGALLRGYARYGGAAGRLGLPTSDVYAVTGGLRSNFQHGWIRWNQSSNTYTVRFS